MLCKTAFVDEMNLEGMGMRLVAQGKSDIAKIIERDAKLGKKMKVLHGFLWVVYIEKNSSFMSVRR